MSYIFLCPSAMSRRSATNSMYWLMSQPFIPTSATGSASQTNSRSMSTASLTISRTRDLSSLPRRPPAGSQQMEPARRSASLARPCAHRWRAAISLWQRLEAPRWATPMAAAALPTGDGGSVVLGG
ncbi:unnamed protein product [Miscanthus lutarioriparius]|uniref:Uncharacterized protein n=1 Tax=Miscanthus lutarioriparius TaxID=422564 RepID=A0A811S1B4_9POAL|nr:unnamed protein product [Miscanthus lutarioriparius]